MFNRIILKSVAGFLISLTFAAPASGFERLEGERFISACQHYRAGEPNTGLDADKTLCTAFLMGYLAGVDAQRPGDLSDGGFQERALDTRAKGLLYRDRRLKSGKFCLPEEESVDNLVAKITVLSAQGVDTKFAENIVENVLISHYRCPD